MHLQSFPKHHLDPRGLNPGLCGGQHGELIRADWDLPQTPASGSHGNMGVGSRYPFSVLSTNTTLLRSNSTHMARSHKLNHHGNDKMSPLLPPSPPGCHGNQDDREAWSVVRPGHVREKIAIFASACSGECSMDGASEGVSPVGVALKVKGGWEVESRSAKRPRRSGSSHTPHPPANHASPAAPGRMEMEEAEEEPVSVGEMVAFLEHRASKQQLTSVPLLSLQRSSASLTLSRNPPLAPPLGLQEGPQEGSGEPVRVWDLVARLESECLKSDSGSGRPLFRSLRTVGRVLLAGTNPSSSSSQSSVPVATEQGDTDSPPQQDREEAGEPGQTEAPSPSEPQSGDEPPPGELFFPRPLVHNSLSDPGPLPCVSSASPRTASGAEQERPGLSRGFLKARFKLQLLLEPQAPLLLLPHHLLLHILSLLPTRSLAALKCCCRHFRLLIDTYGARPADSRWVSDPRYRDDPCKQCKRRYGRGDVSLCRWHHKPYCQALPYGPGYWMCCHGATKDTPGCNVGLHDNRWVPDFHSFNVPIYRRKRGSDKEV